MNSQFNEEEIIMKKFSGKSGKFLDIGANDPFYLSNTRCLVEAGFSGVLVEPVPSSVKKFETTYANNAGITVCPKAIDDTAGVKDFYVGAQAYLSSLSLEFTQQPSLKNLRYSKTKVDVITPRMLFDEYGYDFDFIDLDVEGSNWAILQHIPFKEMPNLSMICIEHKHDDFDTIDTFMKGFGFKEVWKNYLNIIYEK